MEKKNIFKSLAAFQQECPTIHKATKGYGYSYSDLPTIFKVINPLLKKHGLGFTQLINGNSIDTTLFHVESGEVIESSTEIPQDVALKGMNDFQVLGSAVTYIRRYALSSMLGIVTDKDTDAGGEQAPKKQSPKTKKPITDELLNQYLSHLKKGTAKMDRVQFIAYYDLNAEQLKKLG